MSSQAGIWNFDGRPVDRGMFGKLSSTIEQYGPDGGKDYIDNSIAMAYRAFHTTLESRVERQPYRSARGNVITWDGRLDNREELIPRLHSDLGEDRSDIAIVAAAFERWSSDCFREFVGDWAVAIWSCADQTILLSKDYIGIRHLYYSLSEKGVVWCSDLGGIMHLAHGNLTLNDEYIAGYLGLYPEAHFTPYREILPVPAGKFVRFHDGNATIQSYWTFEPGLKIRYKKDSEYEEHFRRVFREAVRRRLRSDSPILAELSGGLDSSSIVCIADDIVARGETGLPQLDTLSLYDKSEPQGDDWRFFNIVEEMRGRVGYHIDLGKYPASIGLEHRTLVARPGTLPSGQEWELERSTIMERGGYRVVLSGIGGDEFLGGVPEPSPELADLLARFQIVKLARQLEAWSLVKRRPWVHLLSNAFCELLPDWLDIRRVTLGKLEPWIDRQFARRCGLASRRMGPAAGLGVRLPSVRQSARTLIVMACQMSKQLPPNGGCEETRYPFLDQDLVEFATSIPLDQLLRPGERRSLMRRSLIGVLPKEVLGRKTKGVSSRFASAALDNKWIDIERIFRSPLCCQLGYIDRKRLHGELVATRNGNGLHPVRLMRVVSLEIWLRNLSDRGLIDVRREDPDCARAALAQSRA